MLSLRQSRDYQRYKKLKKYFESQTELIASYLPLQQEVDNYFNNITSLKKLLKGKDTVTTGITLAKNDLRKQIADSLALILSKTRAYALKFKNGDLAAETDISNTDIIRTK